MSKHFLLLTLSIMAASFSSLLAQAVEIADARNTSYDKVFRLGDKFVMIGYEKILSWNQTTRQSETRNIQNFTHTASSIQIGQKVYYTTNPTNSNFDLWVTNGQLTQDRRVMTFTEPVKVIQANGQLFVFSLDGSGRINEVDTSNWSRREIGRIPNCNSSELEVQYLRTTYLFKTESGFGFPIDYLYTYSKNTRTFGGIGGIIPPRNLSEQKSDSVFYNTTEKLYVYHNGRSTEIGNNSAMWNNTMGWSQRGAVFAHNNRAYVVDQNSVTEYYPTTNGGWVTKIILDSIAYPTSKRPNGIFDYNIPLWFSNDSLFLMGYDSIAGSINLQPTLWRYSQTSGASEKKTLRLTGFSRNITDNSWLKLCMSPIYMVNGKPCYTSFTPDGYDLLGVDVNSDELKRITMPGSIPSTFLPDWHFGVNNQYPRGVVSSKGLYVNLFNQNTGNDLWYSDGSNPLRLSEDATSQPASGFTCNILLADSTLVVTKKEGYDPNRNTYQSRYFVHRINGLSRTASQTSNQLRAKEWLETMNSDSWSSSIYGKSEVIGNGSSLTLLDIGREKATLLASGSPVATYLHDDLLGFEFEVLVMRDSTGNIKWYKHSSPIISGSLTPRHITDQTGNVFLLERSVNGRFMGIGDTVEVANHQYRLVKIQPNGSIAWKTPVNYFFRININVDGDLEVGDARSTACYDKNTGVELWAINAVPTELFRANNFEGGVVGVVPSTNGSIIGISRTTREPLIYNTEWKLGKIISVKHNPKGGFGVLTTMTANEKAALRCKYIGVRNPNSARSIVILDENANPRLILELDDISEYAVFNFDKNGNIILAERKESFMANTYRPGYEGGAYSSAETSLIIQKYHDGYVVAQRELYGNTWVTDLKSNDDNSFIFTGFGYTLDSFRITANFKRKAITAKLFFDQHFPLPPTVKDEAIAQDDLTILPVPTDNYLYVRSDDDDLQDATFECFDVQGRQVALPQGNFMYKEWSVDVSFIPSGMYFLRVKSGKDSHALKFIKN